LKTWRNIVILPTANENWKKDVEIILKKVYNNFIKHNILARLSPNSPKYVVNFQVSTLYTAWT